MVTPVTTNPSIDQLWQTLLRRAGKPRTPHFRMDAATLAPLQTALRHLGEPQDALRIVHIAGSKGKGSTALHLEALLRAHGQQVATFTSPHLQHWRERFRIDGAPVADPALLRATQRVLAVLETPPGAEELRFFDVLVAIAMVLFADSALDWALLEAGVGGRFDASNVVQPALCILTRMELEHCDVLGNTLADIAAHKAGIIKPETPVVCAALPRMAQEVVTRVAKSVGAPLLRAGIDFEYDSERTGAMTWQVNYHGRHTLTFEIRAGARALIENAALALAAFETLGLRLEPRGVTNAFAAILPARCEFLLGDQRIVLDAAHTPASLDALHDAIVAIPHRHRHFLAACSSERHMHSLVRLFKGAQRVVTTRADSRFTVAPQTLMHAVQREHPLLEVVAVDDIVPALDTAADGLEKQDLLCIAGSTYLAGRMRALLKERAASAAAQPGC